LTSAARSVAAVDLGATSGRVAVGVYEDDRVQLDVAHRFRNEPVWLPDGLHWNLPTLHRDVLDGLALAADGRRLDGIGIDSWGCDYALLDSGNRVLGLPYHYRDHDRTAPTVLARAFERVGQHELYARTGIQTMPINTIFQLVSEAQTPAAVAASRIALIPDLLGLWLTGSLRNEFTAASTTGLLDARDQSWALDLIERLGISTAPFQSEIAPPGIELGPVLEGHSAGGAAVGSIVRTVASHDTASAFVATTLLGPGTAVISSGTWSLVGIELDEPMLGADAEAFNLTNERGFEDTVRVMRNVMGLWLIEEFRRGCGPDAPAYAELYAEASSAGSQVPLFDPDRDELLHPGPMVERISALCAAGGQRPPSGRGELVASILTSLACKYRLVVEQLEVVSGRRIDRVQVVGGGSQNQLLCQVTADTLGREVLAGPAEATLLGNVLTQLAALGEVSTLAEMRELSGRSISLPHYLPASGSDGEGVYQRFLQVTGLSTGRPVSTAI
jgi:rhamnulokinase